jgi:hypothetical protein
VALLRDILMLIYESIYSNPEDVLHTTADNDLGDADVFKSATYHAISTYHYLERG